MNARANAASPRGASHTHPGDDARPNRDGNGVQTRSRRLGVVRAHLSLLAVLPLCACGPVDDRTSAIDLGTQRATLLSPAEAEGRFSPIGSATAPPDEESSYYRNYHEHEVDGAREIYISGKVLTFDRADANNLLVRLQGTVGDVADCESDCAPVPIRRVDISAERLTIRTRVHVPGAEVHVRAQELRFEDEGDERGAIDTTPVAITRRAGPASEDGPASDGRDGEDGGDIHVFAQAFHSDATSSDRFVARGADGQPAGLGRRGVRGKSGTRLVYSNPKEIACGRKYGVAKWTGHRFVAAEVTMAELERSGIAIAESGAQEAPFEPTSGSDAKPGGKPGEGGNGGRVITNLSGLSPYARLQAGRAGRTASDTLGGRAGTPVNALEPQVLACQSQFIRDRCIPTAADRCRRNSVISQGRFERRLVVDDIQRHETFAGTRATAPSADRPRGDDGQVFSTTMGPFEWLDPRVVERVVTYADDAFLNGHRTLARTVLEEQLGALEAYALDSSWDDTADERREAFATQEVRIGSLLDRLEAHEDYFGNPLGWTPALSLEANRALFDQEVQWSVRMLYAAEWIERENASLSSKLDAIRAARGILGEQLRENEERYDDALARVPDLSVQAQDIDVQLQSLQADLMAVEAALTQRAQENVEDRHRLPWWRKGLTILAAVAKVIPVGQPVLGGMGATLALINGFDANKPLDTIIGAADVVSAFSNSDVGKKAADAKAKVDKVKDAKERGDKTALKSENKELRKFAKDLAAELKKHKDMFKQAEAPKSEVADQLKKLKKESPEFQRLATQVETLIASRAKFAKDLTDVLETLAQSLARMDEAYSELASFMPEVAQAADVVLDEHASVSIQAMRDRAQKRLIKYQYWLARAYEYRTLRPYSGDLTLEKLLGEVRTLVLSADSEFSVDAADGLATIFEEELANVVDEIVSDYVDHAVEHTVPVTYSLSSDQLSELNAGRRLAVNFWEEGLFRPDHEDVRLVGLEVADMDVTETGSSDAFAYMDLDLDHAGISRVWRDGEVFAFQHYNKKSRQPMRWSTRLQNGRLESHKPSAASQSLIRSLSGIDGESIMLFSRPSAWSDILMKKTVVLSDGDTDFDISRLDLRVIYDYVPSSRYVAWPGYRDGQDEQLGELYESLLGRAPEGDELSGGRFLLDVGYQTQPLTEALKVQHHQELLENQAMGLYRDTLGREGEDHEIAWASRRLDEGHGAEEVSRYIQLITETIESIYGRSPSFEKLVTSSSLLDDGWL